MVRKGTVHLSLVVALAVVVSPLPAAEEYKTNTHGLDRRNMDPEVDPCDNFYLYANGKWIARNPVPVEQSIWSTSNELRERNYILLREILTEASGSDAEKGSNRQKAGSFWKTAMDTEKLAKDRSRPIQSDLERIEAISNLEELQAFVNSYHAEGTTLLFDPGVFQDLMKSDQYIVYATQGGLGLPDRDYYTREDEEAVELRQRYVAHVSTMLQLLGDAQKDADAAAQSILDLETRLAEASLTNVELRDPANYYNIKSVAETNEATPNFSWSRYFEALDLEGIESFSYAHPRFFAEMDKALGDVSLDTWKDYLRWNVINYFAAYLSDDLVEQDFDFYRRTLRGTEEMRPRWKRAVDQVSGSMGEALGQVYVERAFPPETKARADEMIEDLRAAVKVRISTLEWMSDETKAKALEKLAAFNSKIGYPDQWRDYSALEIGLDSYLANVRAANAFEMRRNLDKIGQPIDRNEWAMSPQTVNAYYNPVMNEIVFPAAIMQPPYFEGEMDDAVNYGGMGSVIGHEFMHGFDDQGSKFDAQGNMKSWWTDEDRERFESRTQKLVSQYSHYVAVDDLHVNGELTLGENIGDLAGLTMAYHALKSALESNNPGEIDGFTPEQRFFLAWAQAWRRNYRPEALKLQVNTDPHSPGNFRTIGPLSNMPEFAEAFGCKKGDVMVLSADNRADIW